MSDEDGSSDTMVSSAGAISDDLSFVDEKEDINISTNKSSNKRHSISQQERRSRRTSLNDMGNDIDMDMNNFLYSLEMIDDNQSEISINNNNNNNNNNENSNEFDTEELIEREEEKLEFFSESLKQCDKLSNTMIFELNRLQFRLQTLQKSLDPIRRATKDVSMAEKNINKTMNELKKVIEYQQLISQPLNIIKSKQLKSINLTKLLNNEINQIKNNEFNDPFLNWIEKINEAKNYFKKNKFKSSNNAIDNLKEIANIAILKMEKYFTDTIEHQTLSATFYFFLFIKIHTQIR